MVWIYSLLLVGAWWLVLSDVRNGYLINMGIQNLMARIDSEIIRRDESPGRFWMHVSWRVFLTAVATVLATCKWLGVLE